MTDLNKETVEDDVRVLAALRALQVYAESYDSANPDLKGCKPNMAALRVLARCFPNGQPNSEYEPGDAGEAEYMRWFDCLMECYDIPEEIMLADACENKAENLIQEYAKDDKKKRKYFLSLVEEQGLITTGPLVK